MHLDLMRRRAAAVAPYAVIMAVAIYLLWLAGRFDYDTLAGSVGPGAWPRLIIGLLIVTCGIQILRVWIWEATPDAGTSQPEASFDEEEVPEPASVAKASAALACIVAYLLVFNWLGFALATFLFLAVFSFMLGYRRWQMIIPVSALLTLVFMFLFMKVIYVSLPLGVEPFSRISLLLMRLLAIS